MIFLRRGVSALISVVFLGILVSTPYTMAQKTIHIEVLGSQGKALKNAVVQLIRPDGSVEQGVYSKKKKAYRLEVRKMADRYGLSVSCEAYHATGQMLEGLPEDLSFTLTSAKEAKRSPFWSNSATEAAEATVAVSAVAASAIARVFILVSPVQS